MTPAATSTSTVISTPARIARRRRRQGLPATSSRKRSEACTTRPPLSAPAVGEPAAGAEDSAERSAEGWERPTVRPRGAGDGDGPECA
ncbi:hypothetical protein GCM10023160_32810 [Brachybacterium paraconglomeratum]